PPAPGDPATIFPARVRGRAARRGTASRAARTTRPGRRHYAARNASSVMLPQVHAPIQFRDLLTVTIEQLGRAQVRAEQRIGQTPFLRLGPARVADGRIHVGVETVLI